MRGFTRARSNTDLSTASTSQTGKRVAYDTEVLKGERRQIIYTSLFTHFSFDSDLDPYIRERYTKFYIRLSLDTYDIEVILNYKTGAV